MKTLGETFSQLDFESGARRGATSLLLDTSRFEFPSPGAPRSSVHSMPVPITKTLCLKGELLDPAVQGLGNDDRKGASFVK